MCGISGYFGGHHFSPNYLNIKSCIEKMKNRGPDSQDYFIKKNKKNTIVLINSRLKILDRSPKANQPMVDENGALIFNGLIYNYLELRNKLKKKIKFKTLSDTEVLLKLLGEKGENGIKFLDGMWAFAYYSFRKKKLILSRDPFGEKPLYFTKNENYISFGSSPNFILSLIGGKNINFTKIKNTISFGLSANMFNDETFFSEIKMHKPNSVTIIDNKLNFSKKKFWYPEKVQIDNSIRNPNDVQAEIKELINKNFGLRTRSDYKISSLLSGGIDSSLVTSIANKKLNSSLNCFSIKATNKLYDESKIINKTVKFLNLKHNYVEPEKISFEELENIIKVSGTIIPTITYLLYHIIAKNIKNLGIKTILQGNGGDEMFGGYYTHYISYLHSIRNQKIYAKEKKLWSKYIKPTIRSDHLKNFNNFSKKIREGINPNFHNLNLKLLDIDALIKNINKKREKRDFFKDILYKDLFYYSLPNQLICSDNIAMYNSLENRSPFLSKEIFEFSFKLPNQFLISEGYTKNILRKSFKKQIPEEIMQNREKIGFFGNIKNVIDLKEKKLFEIIMDNKFLKKNIKEVYIKKIFKEKNFINNKDSHYVFTLINIAIFLNIFEKNYLSEF